MSSKQSDPYKDFSIFSQKCTVHYTCKKADLNLILVAEMTNGFIFQTIDSLTNNNFLLTISIQCQKIVMRINKMITKEKMPRFFIEFFQILLKGNVWRSVWRIYMWVLGLKS